MEASEAIRRIFWRHRWLLLALTLLPVALVVPLRERLPVTYAATAQVQGQSVAPDSATQVTAIQSRLTAAATSPALVRQAITAAGLVRDPTLVAQHAVTVTPLSSSAVMLITVTDASPSAAIRLDGALARIVVSDLNQLGTRDNPQLSALNQATVRLTLQRDRLTRELDSAQSSGQTATSVKVQSLLAQLSSVEQQLSANLSSIQQVLANVSAAGGAQLISTPAFVTGVSRHVAAYGALAGLLGLVLGLLFATVREVIRPTVAQPGAGARELGVVLFGTAEARRGDLTALEPGLAGHLSLAAQRLGARTVVLTGPVPRAQLSALARFIASELPAAARDGGGSGRSWAGTPILGHAGYGTAGSGAAPRAAAAAPSPAIVALPDLSLSARPADAVLAVVLPPYAPHYALDRIADLRTSTQWPVLGVIGLRQRGRRGRTRRPAPAPDPGQPAAAAAPPGVFPPAPSSSGIAAADGAEHRGALA